MMLLYLLITPRVSTLGRPGLGAPVPLRLGTSKKEMAVTKVVKEDKLCDQTYRGSASRGTSVPFFTRAPDGGTPLLPNNSSGPRVETLGYDKACKECPAGAHRSAGLKARWYRPWVVLRAGRKSSEKKEHSLGSLARRPWPNASAKK